VFSGLAVPAALAKAMEVVTTPGYILDRQAPSGPGSTVLYSLILELSLYAGCSRRERAAAVIRNVFPASDLLGDLPSNLASSKFGYALYLWRPTRLTRGFVALARLLWWIARSPGWTGASPLNASSKQGASTIPVPTEALQ
jgi:hypothetical protein